MATHDYVIDNSTGANVRSDINSALSAIVSNNSSDLEPVTKYAYMWWADTLNGILKIRNTNNTAWVELLQLDGTLTLENGTKTAPGLAQRSNLNTGIFFSAANTFNISTAGLERLELGTTTIFNEDGEDVDFRIEGDTVANLFYVDAGNNRIGIQTASPQHDLDILKTTSGADSSFRVGSTASTGDNDATIIINNGGSGDASLRFDYESSPASRCKIYVNSSTKDLIFDTDGDETMRLKSDHKVGIGTSNPEAKLHVSDTYHFTAAGGNSTTGMQIGNYVGSTNTYGVLTLRASTHRFDISGNPKMIIDSSGRVGIGTSNPTSLLTLNGSTNPKFQIDVSGTIKASLLADTGANVAMLSSHDGYDLQFSSAAGGGTNPVMTLLNSGNVGIGTDSPASLLHLNRTSTTGYSTTATTNDSSLLIVNAGVAGHATMQFQVVSGGTANTGQATISAFPETTSSKNTALSFGTRRNSDGAVVERMRINSSGSVLIGANDTNHASTNANDLCVGNNDSSLEHGITIGSNVAGGIRWADSASGSAGIIEYNHNLGSMTFSTETVPIFTFNSSGRMFSVPTYNNTTSNSANVSVPNSDGQFFRSTSSIKYKDNVTTLTDTLADKILDCRSVSYTSKCSNDDKTTVHYGFIAEEVHEIDTSLVSYDNNTETPEPEGVQYDRFIPALVNLVKRQKTQIETLETKVAALEAA